MNSTVEPIALALLPPDIARKLQVTSYIFCGTSAIFIWDAIWNLHADYKLLFKTKIGLPTLVYFISRIGTMVFVIGYTMFSTSPIGNCNKTGFIFSIFYPVGVSGSALLFFFRVRAVFFARKYIVWVFFALWICVFASCMVIPFAGRATNIGPTKYCIETQNKPFGGAAVIVPNVHDTLVFLAISYQLLCLSHAEQHGMINTIRAFVSGSYLPALSKSILHNGQVYYMVTVVGNLLTTIVYYQVGISPDYRDMLVIPNVVLTNIMACYVYRNTKLGLMEDPGTLLSACSRIEIQNNAGEHQVAQRIDLMKIQEGNKVNCPLPCNYSAEIEQMKARINSGR
ncbi:hypothetical protein BT96DRAFT_967765 [Gymnopus androsaceus JB14]|uniref:Integral membrane protein n=1 Tax=Gymnopus androsaceus JB14 TaxID=1447944 RepID=A0A6A4GXH0_9AGAR|nr:hypothetical protein BT96DRAFT_967765 [Gymnopus androsaceus JB14]